MSGTDLQRKISLATLSQKRAAIASKLKHCV
nr:MAG TPA: hypothetical protein [Caudoviricetes sp.]